MSKKFDLFIVLKDYYYWLNDLYIIIMQDDDVFTLWCLISHYILQNEKGDNLGDNLQGKSETKGMSWKFDFFFFKDCHY